MLEFKNITVSKNGITLLEDINLNIETGKLTVLIGPNACGKTTLLQTLNGSSRVADGEILLNGEDYLSLPPKERAKRLSFLPQVHSVIPSIPVKTLVSHGRFPYLGFSRRSGEEDKKIVNDAMIKTGVDEYSSAGVDTLSGGVRQRAFIAMQLAQQSDTIIADEPATYLDQPSRKKITEIYSELRDEGKTVVLVLHELSTALEIADRIIVMKDRKIAAEGTPDQIISSGIITEVFGVGIKRFSDDEGDYLITV
ncbi:MAG: ABC transporter ATP-binding protein [Lachnospiraceae bacterium]|nr:ABC transporter ATP-binding protein [Lachnospiraceae bacterium]